MPADPGPAMPDAAMIPHPRRCDPRRPDYDEILRRHREAVESGRAHYIDPGTGYQVFTAKALWDRGYCCETGCRHCPWVERPA
jgi:hypothetical protein